jgi:glutamate-ammonia-ligase adenylyltransferase
MSRPTSPTLRLARYGFTDVAAAARLLGPAPDGLGLLDEAEPGPVLTALGGAADPDLALRQLHRVAEASARAGAADPVAAMRADADLAASLSAVLGASIPLGDDMVADPGRWEAPARALVLR